MYLVTWKLRLYYRWVRLLFKRKLLRPLTRKIQSLLLAFKEWSIIFPIRVAYLSGTLVPLIRVIRFLGKERQFIPELRSVSSVVPGHLYKHYGRVFLAHPNPDTVSMTYERRTAEGEKWQPIRKQEYEHTVLMQEKGFLRSVQVRFYETGAKCAICACETLKIPCQCAFRDGARTGYYELILQSRQQSDQTTL